jgi:hypothetical protein
MTNFFFSVADMFLGYEFSTYGVSAASFLEEQPEERIDPMSRVFPRSAYTDKKKIKFSSLTDSSYRVKYLCISSHNRKPFLIYDFATAPV